MKFYIQVNENNIVTDAITYPHEGYVEIEKDVLPNGAIGGWFKLINDDFVEQVDLNPTTIDNQIKDALDDYTMELIELGAL